MENKKKIIIDTDCGSDDAMAIAMAMNDDNYQVVMFTTVSGNVRMHQATLNTLTTLEYCDTYYPPVYEGSDQMLIRDWVGAAETHGNDGLGDIGLAPKKLTWNPGNAVIEMLEALKNSEDGEIDIIALGPLTNIALAIKLNPKVFSKVGRVIVMGTAGLGRGNVSPVAEFNIWQDAEAAKIVLEAGLSDLIFVGWDACLGESMLNKAEINKIEESGKLGKFCIESNKILMEMNKGRFGEECLDMADPACTAAALYPQCIKECEKYYCEIDIANGPSYGSMLVDVNRFSGKKENAYVCSSLKSALYKDYIYQTLGVK